MGVWLIGEKLIERTDLACSCCRTCCLLSFMWVIVGGHSSIIDMVKNGHKWTFSGLHG